MGVSFAFWSLFWDFSIYFIIVLQISSNLFDLMIEGLLLVVLLVTSKFKLVFI